MFKQNSITVSQWQSAFYCLMQSHILLAKLNYGKQNAMFKKQLLISSPPHVLL